MTEQIDIQANNVHRGHALNASSHEYADPDLPRDARGDTFCGKCGEENTAEGHDACLGTLPGPIMNACCGHGIIFDAYIQFNDGHILRGKQVTSYLQSSEKKAFPLPTPTEKEEA